MKHSEAFEKLVDEVRGDVTEISPEDVRSRMETSDDLTLIDVREDHEWDAGGVAGSIHIGRGVLERDIEKQIPDKTRELVLYCGGGYRSALAAYNIQKMGYSRVYSMAGGIRKWRELAFPEESRAAADSRA